MSQLPVNKYPLVTIGIPTYNRPLSLEKAIKSAIDQTYQNIEIIISDNSSTNKDSKKVIEKYKAQDQRITYFIHEKNIGANKNFNFILDKAKGKYFMWLADDDWLDNNYVEECAHFLNRNHNYSSAYGVAKYHDEIGNYLFNDEIILLEDENYKKRILNYYKNVTFNSIFYGLKRTKDKHLFRMSNKIADDWVIIARLLTLGKIKLIDSTHTNIRAGGVSRNIDNLTFAQRSNRFVRSFPLLNIALNGTFDVLFNQKLSKHSLSLALKVFWVLRNKWKIKNEYLIGIKVFLGLRKKTNF